MTSRTGRGSPRSIRPDEIGPSNICDKEHSSQLADTYRSNGHQPHPVPMQNASPYQVSSASATSSAPMTSKPRIGKYLGRVNPRSYVGSKLSSSIIPAVETEQNGATPITQESPTEDRPRQAESPLAIVTSRALFNGTPGETPSPPTLHRRESAARRVISATSGAEERALVDITGVDDGASIRRIIFEQMHLSQTGYELFVDLGVRGGISAPGPVKPVSDDWLSTFCDQLGDEKGTLKFLVKPNEINMESLASDAARPLPTLPRSIDPEEAPFSRVPFTPPPTAPLSYSNPTGNPTIPRLTTLSISRSNTPGLSDGPFSPDSTMSPSTPLSTGSYVPFAVQIHRSAGSAPSPSPRSQTPLYLSLDMALGSRVHSAKGRLAHLGSKDQRAKRGRALQSTALRTGGDERVHDALEAPCHSHLVDGCDPTADPIDPLSRQQSASTPDSDPIPHVLPQESSADKGPTIRPQSPPSPPGPPPACQSPSDLLRYDHLPNEPPDALDLLEAQPTFAHTPSCSARKEYGIPHEIPHPDASNTGSPVLQTVVSVTSPTAADEVPRSSFNLAHHAVDGPPPIARATRPRQAFVDDGGLRPGDRASWISATESDRSSATLTPSPSSAEPLSAITANVLTVEWVSRHRATATFVPNPRSAFGEDMGNAMAYPELPVGQLGDGDSTYIGGDSRSDTLQSVVPPGTELTRHDAEAFETSTEGTTVEPSRGTSPPTQPSALEAEDMLLDPGTSSYLESMLVLNQSSTSAQRCALRETLESLKDLRLDWGRLEPVDTKDPVVSGYSTVRCYVLDGNTPKARFVAVKELQPKGDNSERQLLVFKLARELRIWASVKHPNLLPLVGFYLSSDLTVANLISPYEGYGHVTQYILEHKCGLIPRLHLAIDVTQGLAYLHGLSPPICHGDPKSHNVLVSSFHRAMLCDFGLAKVLDGMPSGLTTSTGFKGSMRYLSREVVVQEKFHRNLKSDIWALGCVLLEIVCSVLPHAHLSHGPSLIMSIFAGGLPATPAELDIPEGLRTLLLQCWDKEDRRPTASACLDALYSILAASRSE